MLNECRHTRYFVDRRLSFLFSKQLETELLSYNGKSLFNFMRTLTSFSEVVVPFHVSMRNVWALSVALYCCQHLILFSFNYSIYVVDACSVAQSCPTLCDAMRCSLPSFSVHGIFLARIMELVISFSRESFQPRDRTYVSCIAGRFFTAEPPGKLIYVAEFHYNFSFHFPDN